MTEIERKFLVISQDFEEEAFNATKLVQGYLNRDPVRTVRVRIKGKKGFLTIKGKSNESGLSRYEWEKQIKQKEAEALLQLCEEGIVEKVRYEVKFGNHIFEVDKFSGDNEGLVLAEVELRSEEEEFLKPVWLGKEVTGDRRYYNSSLSKNPFVDWEKQK